MTFPKTFTKTEVAIVGSYTLRVTSDESRNILSIIPNFRSPANQEGKTVFVKVDPIERRGPNAAEKTAFFATVPSAGESREDFDKRACALYMANQYGL